MYSYTFTIDSEFVTYILKLVEDLLACSLACGVHWECLGLGFIQRRTGQLPLMHTGHLLYARQHWSPLMHTLLCTGQLLYALCTPPPRPLWSALQSAPRSFSPERNAVQCSSMQCAWSAWTLPCQLYPHIACHFAVVDSLHSVWCRIHLLVCASVFGVESYQSVCELKYM